MKDVLLLQDGHFDGSMFGGITDEEALASLDSSLGHAQPSSLQTGAIRNSLSASFNSLPPSMNPLPPPLARFVPDVGSAGSADMDQQEDEEKDDEEEAGTSSAQATFIETTARKVQNECSIGRGNIYRQLTAGQLDHYPSNPTVATNAWSPDVWHLKKLFLWFPDISFPYIEDKLVCPEPGCRGKLVIKVFILPHCGHRD